MRRFAYEKPGHTGDALSAMGEGAALLAGGTDLLVAMKAGRVAVDRVVDLGGIAGMDRITFGGGIRIGALATIREIECSEELRRRVPLLPEAAATVASVQIRNRATIGGNLCNASPASDMSVALLATGCRVKAISMEGIRTVGIADLFTGPGRTVLGGREILTEVVLPEGIERRKGIFLKLGQRRAMEISIVNMALCAEMEEGSGVCREIRIAMGAVAPTPMRARKAEAYLAGTAPDERRIARAVEIAAEECSPITDLRASADYRRDMVAVLAKRGINALLAGGKVPAGGR